MEYLNSQKKKGRKEKPDPRAARKALAQQKQRQKAPVQVQEQEEELDDDDLLASTSGIESQNSGLSPPSVFCSLSGRSHHLTRAVQIVARRAQNELFPRIQRRIPLGRRK